MDSSYHSWIPDTIVLAKFEDLERYFVIYGSLYGAFGFYDLPMLIGPMLGRLHTYVSHKAFQLA